MTKTKDASALLFKLLAVQYKPLEKKFLEFCKKEKQTEIISKYKKATHAKKIAILDSYANFLGL